MVRMLLPLFPISPWTTDTLPGSASSSMASIPPRGRRPSIWPAQPSRSVPPRNDFHVGRQPRVGGQPARHAPADAFVSHQRVAQPDGEDAASSLAHEVHGAGDARVVSARDHSQPARRSRLRRARRTVPRRARKCSSMLAALSAVGVITSAATIRPSVVVRVTVDQQAAGRLRDGRARARARLHRAAPARP